MIPLSQPTKIVESSDERGVFVVEGLYPGYGITMGNSLRRALLSSLEGAATTQVKIKGVNHEFSTLPGVREDILSILLNLKKMRFRMYGDAPQKAVLKAKGEKEVFASQFELPASLTLINGDLHIASLTEKTAELEIEIQVERGVGYVPAEERKKEKQEVGSIALDAIFTPIRRVSSRVEDMRVGERTDFNRLVLEIETDGTISPQEALHQATDILLKQFETVMAGIKGAAEEKAANRERKVKQESKARAEKKSKKAASEKKTKKEKGKE